MNKLLLLLFILIPSYSFAENGFVVLELFTSEGCSSCPAADDILINYQQRAKNLKLPIYTISHHVDYWNYLGWDDPFSTKFSTQRQREYAALLNAGSSFTPQLIVNGELSLVGSDQNKISDAIHKYLKNRENQLKIISLIKTKNEINLKLNLKSSDQMILNVFISKQVEASKVTAGENRGKTLKHTNSVIKTYQFEKLNVGENYFNIPLPQESNLSLTAILQANKTKKIFGSDEAYLAENN